MKAANGERIMRSTYELIGEPVGPSDLAVDQDVADELHAFVAQNFIPKVMSVIPDSPTKPPVRHLSEAQDTTMVGSSFGRQHYQAPDLSVGTSTVLKLSHHSDESWMLRVWNTRYLHDGTENKVATRYFVDAFGGQLMQAKREVRIVHTRSDEAYAQLLNPDAAPPKIARKAYELPLTNDDCLALQDRLARVARRMVSLAS